MTKRAGEAGPVIKVLFGASVAMGPGKARLLDCIERIGSISGAAREMGMSYRRAWILVDTMNHCFREPLVQTAAGGQGGGGATVTPFGREVLAQYRAMERRATQAVADEMDTFARFLGDNTAKIE